MKAVRVFGVLVIAVQLISLAISGLSFYTVFEVARSTFFGDGINVDTTVEEATWTSVMSLEVSPRNGGYIGADLTFELGVLDDEENYISRNMTSVHLDAGEQKHLTLSICIPETKIREMEIEGREGFFEITLSIRTLNDLVGFSNTFRMRGGGPA